MYKDACSFEHWFGGNIGREPPNSKQPELQTASGLDLRTPSGARRCFLAACEGFPSSACLESLPRSTKCEHADRHRSCSLQAHIRTRLLRAPSAKPQEVCAPPLPTRRWLRQRAQRLPQTVGRENGRLHVVLRRHSFVRLRFGPSTTSGRAELQLQSLTGAGSRTRSGVATARAGTVSSARARARSLHSLPCLEFGWGSAGRGRPPMHNNPICARSQS